METINNKIELCRFYLIYSKLGNYVYAGSTTLTLNSRQKNHITDYNHYQIMEKKHGYTASFDLFDKYGVTNCKIKELENKMCTREERFELEGKYIVEYKNNPEYNCVNIIINTGKCVGLPKNVSIQGEHNMLIKSNKTGVAGVMFHKCSGLWRARISFKGKRMELGDYPTFEEAVQARLKKENQLLGTNHK